MRPLARSSTRSAPLEARARRVVGWLAVDEELRSLGVKIGGGGSGGVSLFADDKKQADFNVGFAELVCCGDLRGDDALGVAGAAAIKIQVVFGAAEEGRDGVHVGGKDDIGGDARERGCRR